MSSEATTLEVTVSQENGHSSTYRVEPHVPEGYKRTELGVFPADWHVVQLTQVAVLESGHTPSRRRAQYWNGGIPWVSLHDTDRLDENVIHDTAQTISQLGLQNSSARLLPPGTVIFSRTATVGKTSILGREMATSQDFACYICGPRLHNKFLLYAFRGMTARWKSLMAGSIHNTVYMPVFRSLCIPLPPIEQQRGIATALSNADALLTSLEKLIGKKRDLKQAAMQQLLTGQTRLPGFEGDWRLTTIEQIAHIVNGGTPSTTVPSFWDGEIAWCTPTDITGIAGAYLSSTERTISDEGLRNCSAQLLPPGTLLLCSRATIGELKIATGWICTNQGFKSLIVKEPNSNVFLYYLLLTMKSAMVERATGSTFLEISRRDTATLAVSIPGPAEQRAIATVLSDMDAEIEALEARLEKTRALKQGMMQELLTGRTRLVAPGVADERTSTEAKKDRGANVHFRRSVLAAEIVDRLHEEPTFGHVKLQKLMFLVETLCGVDTGSTYRRKAAGPYDNTALRSIDSQLLKQQWFEVRKDGQRYRYSALAKRGGHRPYFERYYFAAKASIENILSTFKSFDTQRCEIVATLLAAWQDLLRAEDAVTDERIVHEVLNNWHEAKQRIPEDRWLSALRWMRDHGFVPREVSSS